MDLRLTSKDTSLRAPVVGRQRLAGRAALLGTVVAMHACVMHGISQQMLDFETASEMPARIELVYGRDMESSTPPAAVEGPTAPRVASPPPRSERQATPVADAASAPAQPPPPPVEAPEQVAAEPVDGASEASPAMPAASSSTGAAAPGLASVIGPTSPAASPAADASSGVAAAAPAASAASAEAYSWPPSTRITYELTGNYRGEVHGSATVDWVRVGARYQVHLDVLVGPSFAPILSRRMSSEGQLTDAGLAPERYDEDSKAMFRDRRRAQVLLERDAVVLNSGERLERLAGVQDSASQFVQLAYLFSRHPELLTPGGTVDIPLALPRRMGIWTYDVRNPEVLHTPFGALDAVPLQPRRDSRKKDELSAQVWFAPSLRYLPVRIRIQQDNNTDTYIDLMIERRPQLEK
ncbi:MAG: DUF3108 domain-containing protein [Rhizobacter sp.]